MRNRPTLSLLVVLLAGCAAVSAGADEHVEDAESIEAPQGAAEVLGEEAGGETPEGADQGLPAAAEDESSEGSAEDVDDAVDETAFRQLTSHSAEYRVKISVLSGRLNTSLVRNGSWYEANHRIRPTGLARMVSGGAIEEFSRFESSAHGVVPVHYVSNDTLTRDKTRATIDFDWETNTMTGTVNDQPVEDVLDELAHDRVSIQYELMSDLLNGGLAERYVLFDIDEIKILTVSLVGTREIRVPAGEFTAIGVQHQAEGSSRVTTLWCVEELGYLPVMIEQHRNGELRMRASLREYTPIEG